MPQFRASLYRGCMVAVLILLLLTAFCILNVEQGSGAFYLCVFSLIVDIPFFAYLLYQLIRDCRKAAEVQENETGNKSEIQR